MRFKLTKKERGKTNCKIIETYIEDNCNIVIYNTPIGSGVARFTIPDGNKAYHDFLKLL